MNVYQANQYGASLIQSPKTQRRFHCRKGKWGLRTYFTDRQTGVIIGPQVGFCNCDSCELNNLCTPTDFFKSRGVYTESYHKLIFNQEAGTVQRRLAKCSMISPYVVDQSRSHYLENQFVTYLRSLFNEATVNQLIEQFRIGTAHLWSGASVFWRIDRQGYVRAGKIGLYDPTDGNLLIEQWAHEILKRGPELWEQGEPYTLHQCLFGEHHISLGA
jgi:hypothetical protein